jgi:hypothetical protein
MLENTQNTNVLPGSKQETIARGVCLALRIVLDDTRMISRHLRNRQALPNTTNDRLCAKLYHLDGPLEHPPLCASLIHEFLRSRPQDDNQPLIHVNWGR